MHIEKKKIEIKYVYRWICELILTLIATGFFMEYGMHLFKKITKRVI